MATPYSADNLPGPDYLYVVGNAIPRGHCELETILDRGYRYTSFPELLRLHHLAGRCNIVISGTHGKTTTASLVAHLLMQAGLAPDFLIGGIPLDYGRGYHVDTGTYTVLEGDEYDTCFHDKRPKFVHYLPRYLIITSLEMDHLDIYHNMEDLQWAFCQMVRTIPRCGLVIACGDYPEVRRLMAGFSALPTVYYGENSDNDVVVQRRGPTVCLQQPGKRQVSVTTNLPGMHNGLNVAAAYILSGRLSIAHAEAVRALAGFKGVKRRMQLIYTDERHQVYDDFGHHPRAVRANVLALRENFPDARILGVFEPKTNTSRTNYFYSAYLSVFARLDGLIILDTDDRRKEADPLRIDMLVRLLPARGCWAAIAESSEAVMRLMQTRAGDFDIAVLFSSGSFQGLRQRIMQAENLFNGQG